jgi:hypothetical protein
MDRDNRVAAIVLAAQHLAGLGLLDVRLKVVQTFGEIVVNRLTGLGPLDEDAEVVGATLQGLTGGQLFVEAATALQQLLRLGGILPEIGVGDATLDLVELRTMARFVKDNSADRLPASRDPDTAAPALRGRTPRNAPLKSRPD